MIYKTTNTGSTWISQSSGITNRLTDVACSGPTTCVAVGSSGTVRRTTKVNVVLGGGCGASGPILTLTYNGAGPELTLSLGITVVGLKFQYTGTGAAALKSVGGSGDGGNSLKCVRVSA